MEDKRILRDRLWGALVGLARAAEGMLEVSEGTASAVLKGLRACKNWEAIEETSLQAVITMVQSEKHVLAPDCSTCAAPCGRTNDADMKAVFAAPAGICAAKENLMEALLKTGASCLAEDSETLLTLLGGIFALGYDTDNGPWLLDFAARVSQAGSEKQVM